MTEIYYDPYDRELDADPLPVWRRMRDQAPLYRNHAHDFWALSRFQDMLDASVDVETYSSARGTVPAHRRARGALRAQLDWSLFHRHSW